MHELALKYNMIWTTMQPRGMHLVIVKDLGGLLFDSVCVSLVPECRTIMNVVYRMYSPGEVITLGPCPCSCKDYVWEKKRTDTIPRSFHRQRKLQLTVAAEVGAMYCCKCRTQGYPHQWCQQYQRSCCYGVAGELNIN